MLRDHLLLHGGALASDLIPLAGVSVDTVNALRSIILLLRCLVVTAADIITLYMSIVIMDTYLYICL